MILELTDEEILDFLMTSEFEEDYKPEELKYLLHKFRYFYRVLNGKYDLIKTDSEFKLNKFANEVDLKNSTITQILIDKSALEDKISSLQNRKLTFKERISGKIISNDEN